jgi:hypothetical protein
MRTLESFEPLLDEDVKALRTDVFKMDTFFVTDVDKTPLAVAYMGTLRKSSEEVFRDVEKRLQGMDGACIFVVVLYIRICACIFVLTVDPFPSHTHVHTKQQG